ncbi:tRNA pseudouridine(55) synthase TruB [Homoserinimonas sp. OAct 916]|uniref:tRNA pseudouridine(55) synthase TruB n=1 Tax=Homoserinimonas sp. OAct 916 TaxID=2211450 RepID=UPI000DBE031B|nr:tRNA pseudouridine(55) synthase TruB [Homoserinimonas sp. OAct 916]
MTASTDGPAETGATDRAGRGAGRTSGILLVDKPGGWTSHDVVAKTRRLAETRKVGHAGTLDPMATGLLVLGVGSSTRLLTYLVGADKEYTATIRLGAATTTDDAEGEFLDPEPDQGTPLVTRDAIDEAMHALTGQIEQVPSSVSAIKVDGKRAYARVRSGEDVQLHARPVTVHTFELLGEPRIEDDESGTLWLDLDVRVVCSSGTYIRALARDLGRALQIGGHLTALRRIRVGPFHIDDAHEVEAPDVPGRLIEPADAAGRLFPVVQLTESESIDLGHGKRLSRPDLAGLTPPIAAVSPSGRLVGLVQLRGESARSLINFPEDES